MDDHHVYLDHWPPTHSDMKAGHQWLVDHGIQMSSVETSVRNLYILKKLDPPRVIDPTPEDNLVEMRGLGASVFFHPATE